MCYHCRVTLAQMGGSGKLQALQVLRAVAALAVVYLHVSYGPAYQASQSGGWFGAARAGLAGSAGVDVFFVISGAIIYQTAFAGGRWPTPLGFLRRRLVRLVPLYYVATALTLGVLLARGDTVQPQQVLTALTFWPAWDRLWLPVMPVGWSLCFELLFYAAAALVLFSRRLFWPLIAVYSIALLRWQPPTTPAEAFLGNAIALEFAFGVLVMRYRQTLAAPAWLAACALAIAVLAITAPNYPDAFYDVANAMAGATSGIRALLFGVPAAIIVWAALNLEQYARHAVLAPLRYIGNASYSIYLIHWTALTAATPWLRAWSLAPAVWVPLGLFSATLLGCAAYELVEKPLHRLLSEPPRILLPAVQGS